MTVHRLRLPFSEVLVDEDHRIIETRFKDGKSEVGTREDSQVNRDEASDQGYQGDDAVWLSLRDHELLHNLVAIWLWDSASPTLRHEAGAERVEYGKRLYEEALVIAFQRHVQTGDVWPALKPFEERLPKWRAKYADALLRMEEIAA